MTKYGGLSVEELRKLLMQRDEENHKLKQTNTKIWGTILESDKQRTFAPMLDDKYHVMTPAETRIRDLEAELDSFKGHASHDMATYMGSTSDLRLELDKVNKKYQSLLEKLARCAYDKKESPTTVMNPTFQDGSKQQTIINNTTVYMERNPSNVSPAQAAELVSRAASNASSAMPSNTAALPFRPSPRAALPSNSTDEDMSDAMEIEELDNDAQPASDVKPPKYKAWCQREADNKPCRQRVCKYRHKNQMNT